MVRASELTVKGSTSQYSSDKPTIYCYNDTPIHGKLLPCRYNIRERIYDTIDFPPPKTDIHSLRPDQEKVLNEFDLECLRQDNEAALSNKKVICYTLFGHIHTGFGKSLIGATYAYRQKGPVLIFCNSDAVRKGWISTYNTFFGIDPHVASNGLLGKHDICILSIQLAVRNEFPREEYAHYKTVICDEADVYCTQLAVNILLNVAPKIFIGFTATVRKDNGLDKVLDKFWGERKYWIQRLKEFGETSSMNLHIVYTKHIIDNIYNRKKALDWGAMSAISGSIPERNVAIRNLCIMHQSKKILILCKTKYQVEELYKLLRSVGEDVSTYYWSNKSYFDAHILIATHSKGGRGFDDENVSSLFDGVRFNMIILTSTVKNADQLFGRSRSNHVDIFVLVDQNKTMKNHADDMKNENNRRGATIIEEYI